MFSPHSSSPGNSSSPSGASPWYYSVSYQACVTTSTVYSPSDYYAASFVPPGEHESRQKSREAIQNYTDRLRGGGASLMRQRSEAIANILKSSFPIKCDKCNTPAAALVGTALIIKHRHHGEQHLTVLNLHELASKLGYRK